MEFALILAEGHIAIIKTYFTQEKFPIPHGFTNDDVNLAAPRLFSDEICLSYTYIINGLAGYTAALTTNMRRDIRNYIVQCQNETMEFSTNHWICCWRKELSRIKNKWAEQPPMTDDRQALANQRSHSSIVHGRIHEPSLLNMDTTEDESGIDRLYHSDIIRAIEFTYKGAQTMKSFLDDNFLLSNETSVQLYHEYAKSMPIIDYHCHLSPQEIYENKPFRNLTEAWLYGDHYKWRVMRANGVEEKFITGHADTEDYDRFLHYCRTLPMALGNPLYHWSHLELRRFFDITDSINEINAPSIWDKVNKKLALGGYSPRELIQKSNVTVVCTTDDPIDTLEYHIKIKKLKDFDTAVLPAFRPDKALAINKTSFQPWVQALGQIAEAPITTYEQFLSALESRAEFFHTVGCRVSDHALDTVSFMDATMEEVSIIYLKAWQGQSLTLDEDKKFRSFTLIFLGKIYARLGWIMQLHMNASRNNNSRMFNLLGADTGYDSIHDSSIASSLVQFLDALDKENALSKTILYSLNPNHLDVLSSIIGSFQSGEFPGKIQLGAAWWYNDTKEGMLRQMTTLASIGLLGRFVGMLTDSRSYLSYTRHEYFRRILCNMLGEWVERGEVPNDIKLIGGMVQDICYHNARNYFRFDTVKSPS